MLVITSINSFEVLFLSRGGNVTLHIRARYKYGRVTYTGYQIATHYVITFVYIACSPYM